MQVTDKSIPFMPRTEVIDVRSGAHLGHVFNGETSLISILLTDVDVGMKPPRTGWPDGLHAIVMQKPVALCQIVQCFHPM